MHKEPGKSLEEMTSDLRYNQEERNIREMYNDAAEKARKSGMKDLSKIYSDQETLSMLWDNRSLDPNKVYDEDEEPYYVVNWAEMREYHDIDGDGYYDKCKYGKDSQTRPWSRRQLAILMKQGYLNEDLLTKEELESKE